MCPFFLLYNFSSNCVNKKIIMNLGKINMMFQLFCYLISCGPFNFTVGIIKWLGKWVVNYIYLENAYMMIVYLSYNVECS